MDHRRRWRSALVALATVAALFVLLPGANAAPVPTESATSTAPARVEPWLLEQFDAGDPTQQVLVLVNADSTSAAKQGIRNVGGTPLRSFDSIGFSSALLTAAQLDALRTQPGVTYLQGNRPHADLGTTSTQTTRVRQAEALVSDAYGTELDGSGVGIAVVDSGMAGDHPMFAGPDGTGTRLLNIKQLCVNLVACGATLGDEEDTYFVDATGTDTDVMAAGGHGTHVTGIAGGREVTASNGVEVRGVARNASLYGIGAGAGIFTLNSAASLNWVLEHHADPCGAFAVAPDVVGGCAPIMVVNNSYGGLCGTTGSHCTSDEYDPDDIYVRLSERLVLDGVTVVWAAGNGADPTDTDPPPNDGTFSLTNNPGQSPLPGVLSVADYDDAGAGTRDGALAPSSSRGRKGAPSTYPDVAAPGVTILSACRPWLPVCTSAYADPNYGEITGTSMAAPHVAGVVALLQQAAKKATGEYLSPGEVEDLLEDTAYKFGDPTRYEPDVTEFGQTRNGDDDTSFDAGHGLVDVAAAVTELAAGDIVDPGYDLQCTADEFAPDATGDATQVFGTASLPPETSEDGFDITEIGAHLDDAAGVVRFYVDAVDVGDAPPVDSSGEYLRYDFTYEGLTLELILSRDVGIEPAESFSLIITGDLVNGSTTVASDLTGSFDAEADRISVDVPVNLLVDVRNDDTNPASASIPPEITSFAAGDQIEGVSVIMQRQISAPGQPGLTSTTDQAIGGCPFVLGATGDGGGDTGGTGDTGNGDHENNGKAKGHDKDKANGKAKGHDQSDGSGTALPTEPASDSNSLPGTGALLALVAALGAGGALVTRRMRRRLRVGTAAGVIAAMALLLGLAAPSLPSARAEVTGPVTLSEGTTQTLHFTVDDPNVNTECDASPDSTTGTSSCTLIHVRLDDSLAASTLRWIEAAVVPDGPDADATDVDVYVLRPGDTDTADAITSSAGSAIPGVAGPTEVAFGQFPEGVQAVDVLVTAFTNLPGATFHVDLTGFGREPYID